MDVAQEEKLRSGRTSVDEPLLPPSYEDEPSGRRLESVALQSFATTREIQDAERLGRNKKKRRGNGRFWTILFFALMGPALLASVAMFISRGHYKNGVFSSRPHADGGSFPTEYVCFD